MSVKQFMLLTVGAILLNSASAQTVQQQEKPYIQVSGYAEKEVIPDELYISITLKERFEGRNKITIEQQERQLKEAVSRLGIDPAHLSLSDAGASYIRVNWFNKDVITSKNYQLKVSTAEMVGKVFGELEKLNIKDANLTRVDYSKKDEIKKELRIAAVKSAKEKAIYMTEAIGEKIGKPLFIQEYEYNAVPYEANVMLKTASADMSGAADQQVIEYRKIKFNTTIQAKFEIK